MTSITGIIILAAGTSTRMGQPKQQLIFENETLLQRAVKAAVDSQASVVVVVLGANATVIGSNLINNGAYIHVNHNWQEGMASSIWSGLQQLLNLQPAVKNALFMLCDQPFVNTALINQLIATQQQTRAGIVACAYQDTIGAPVIFNQTYFDDLFALSGQEGAKKLLMKYSNEVIAIPFEKGSMDIDTPNDYQKLTDLGNT